MVVPIDVLQRDVRVCLDSNARSKPLLAIEDSDTLTVDEIIRSRVIEGVRQVHQVAPIHLLDNTRWFGDGVCRDGTVQARYSSRRYWYGHVLLPDDFLRFVVFEMSDWARPIYTAVSMGDKEYRQQHSRYIGLRGSPEEPMCAIVRRPEGLTLEFWSCRDDTADVRQALYVPDIVIDRDDGVEVCRGCYQAAVNMIASLVALTLGQSDMAGLLQQQAISLLKI